MLDLVGSQWNLKLSPKHLNGMFVSAFAFCVPLIVPESIIQSHCSEKVSHYFFALKMK